MRCRFRGRRGTFARPSFPKVGIAWQAQHFRKVKWRFRGRRSTFARSSTDFVAGAALSQSQVKISWQAQHFRKVKHRFRGMRITFARSSAEFVAGAAVSQGQVQTSWQAHHFRKVLRVAVPMGPRSEPAPSPLRARSERASTRRREQASFQLSGDTNSRTGPRFLQFPYSRHTRAHACLFLLFIRLRES